MKLGVALVVVSSLPLSVACASLLGIDDDYVYQDQIAPGSGGAQGSGASEGEGEGGFNVGGFVERDGGRKGGGVPSSGGVSSGGSTALDSGPLSPPDPPDPPELDGGCTGASCPGECPTGHYEGKFTGTHAPSQNFLKFIPILTTGAGAISIQLDGLVSFDVTKGTSGVLVVSGTIRTDPASPLRFIGELAASLQGTLDCEHGLLDAKLVDGTFGASSFPIRFEGKSTGHYDPKTRAVNGDWSENEIPATTGGSGTGTWSATWSGK